MSNPFDGRALIRVEKGRYEAKGRRVIKHSDIKHWSGGGTSLGLSAPVFEVWPHLVEPEKVAAFIADVLNRTIDDKPAPIDMVLYCPSCGFQHVDAPEEQTGWTNPPHRSHQCLHCKTVWRPADVPTNGVAQTETHGKADTFVSRLRKADVNAEIIEDICKELGCTTAPGAALRFVKELRRDLHRAHERHVELIKTWDEATPTERQELDRLRRGWGPSTPTERMARRTDLQSAMRSIERAMDAVVPDDKHDAELTVDSFQAAYDELSKEHRAIIALLQAIPDPDAAESGTSGGKADVNAGLYLVWSHEHGAWWRPERCGYTVHAQTAGRYSKEEALSICRFSRDGWPSRGAPSEIPVRESDVDELSAAEREQPAPQAVDDALLSWLAKHPDLELSCGESTKHEGERAWFVHRVSGSANDREWNAVSEAASPRQALAVASREFGGGV